MNNLPDDPAMLLSFVNTKLRDIYPDLESMCEDLGADAEDIIKKLAGIDYEYDRESNRFV